MSDRSPVGTFSKKKSIYKKSWFKEKNLDGVFNKTLKTL
jgi:hypothetical protein